MGERVSALSQWLYGFERNEMHRTLSRVGLAERVDSFLHRRNRASARVCDWYDNELERR